MPSLRMDGGVLVFQNVYPDPQGKGCRGAFTARACTPGPDGEREAEIMRALQVVRRIPGGKGRYDSTCVNYPWLKPGACSGGPLWGTGLQFNRCEG